MSRVVTYKIEGKDYISKVLETIGGKSVKIRNNIRKIRSKFSSLNRPMKRVALNFLKMERRGKRFVKKIGAGLKKIKNNLGGFGATIAGVFAAREMFNFFGNLKTKASDLNESINKSKVVFGDYFSSIDKYSRKAYLAAGISKEQALANASAFGSMFKELGYGQKATADLSKGAVQLASDLASFNNLDPGQAFDALFAGIKGETQVLATNFGIVLDEAMVKQKAFDMGLVKSTKGTLPKAIKVQATYAAILERTKDAQGDFARTSEDSANSERILRAQVENLQASMGKLLLPTYTKLVKKLREGVSWIDRNKTEILKWTKVSLKVIGVLGGIWIAAKSLIGVVRIISDVRDAYKKLRKSTILAKIAQLAFDAVAMVNPFVWIGIAVVAVGAAVYMIIKHWDKVRTFLIYWGTKILSWFKGFAALMWKINPFRLLLEGIEHFFPGVKAKLIGLFKWVGDLMVVAGKWLWKHSPFMMLLNAADYIFPGIKEKLSKIFEYITDKIMKFVGWLKGSVLGQIISKTFKLNWVDNKMTNADHSKKLAGVWGKKVVPTKSGVDTQIEKDNPYNKVSSILGKAPGEKQSLFTKKTKSKNDLGGHINKGLSSVSSGGGSIKNINISIGKLIEKFVIETNNVGASLDQVKAEVSRVLLDAVNDVNYAG